MGLSPVGLVDLGVTTAAGVLPFLTLEALKARTPARERSAGLPAYARARAE
jgi:hypothetical protein